MVAAMDAVGVDGAVLVSPFSMYRYDSAMRLRFMRLIPTGSGWSSRSIRADPAVVETIADWAGTKGTVGIRVFLRDNVSTDPADPGINRVLATAARHSLPVNLACTGRLDQAEAAGGAKSQHAAGDRPSRPAAAARAAASRGAFRRSAKTAGSGRPR